MKRMSSSLQKLIEIAGPRLSDVRPSLPVELESQAGQMADELLGMLFQKNGFYAFESALHVFPSETTPDEIGLGDWNAPDCWRHSFDGMADGCAFFAEDVFGGQFALRSGGVYQFDPETGDQELLASDLESWAEALLKDYEVLTGYPLAHEWQEEKGALLAGERLLPKVPFVLGGDFSFSNLYLLDATEGMQLRGTIATQIRDLPDGAQVKIEVVD